MDTNSNRQGELICRLYENTKTMHVLNTFEEYDGDSKKYQRLVIENTKYWNSDYNVGINLVIERKKPGENCVGDCTFTKLKMDEAYGLMKYIESEVDQDIINRYKDTNRFYRFFHPFLIRGQNKFNRTGYGWGGAQYGETTDYCCVGVYVTSEYVYKQEKRISHNRPRDWSSET